MKIMAQDSHLKKKNCLNHTLQIKKVELGLGYQYVRRLLKSIMARFLCIRVISWVEQELKLNYQLIGHYEFRKYFNN